jgi:asparagine synthase (glutamine-hydrolysing)
MCGIYGYLSSNEPVDPLVLHKMGKVLRHRGPDDKGELVLVRDSGNVSVGLGHRRLSIIDLSSAGRQPLANENESVWITFNGEIYNFRELRRQLEADGHRFRSKSDAEVIVHLYEKMGIRCLEKLKGMFAFALWDDRKQSLFLARDRIGKKPLHYAAGNGFLIFGSEIKSILQHPQITREIELGSLSKYLTYEYVPAPATIFKSIKKVEPGHYIEYQEGKLKASQYWDIPMEDYPVCSNTENEYVEELRELLKKQIQCRLLADVPVGLFLSGGIDSGLVTALATTMDRNLECFSIGFQERSFDESAYATQVARVLGARHQLKVFNSQQMLDLLPLLSEIIDEPLADPSIFPLFLLSKFASEKVKVVLSGDGADELFAGYQTYQAHKLVSYYDFLPNAFKSLLMATAQALPVSHKYLSLDFKIKQFLKGAGISSEIRFFIWRGAFTDREKKELLRQEVRSELENQSTYEDIFRYINKSRLTKELERILYVSMKLYLQDNNLVTVDRASMANSLEVRSPLLDHEIVEFVSRLPMEYKLKGFKTKYLLKRAAEGILPKAIVHRRKKGFGVPLGRWLMGPLKETMLDLLSEQRITRQGFFNYRHIKMLIEEHLSNKRDNRELLWTLLVFQMWHAHYIERMI